MAAEAVILLTAEQATPLVLSSRLVMRPHTGTSEDG